MSPADRARGKALQERLRLLGQRARQYARLETLEGTYEHGYRIGLAVGYEEAAKRVARLLRPEVAKRGRSR